MEGSIIETSNDPEAVNIDIMASIGSMCEQSRNNAVDSLERQRNKDFVEEPLSSSSLYQPPGDVVDLLSAIPIPCNVIPPGPIPKGRSVTCSGINCEHISSSHQTFVTDDNVEESMYPLNKRPKRLPIYPDVRRHNQVDKLSWEDYLQQNGSRNAYTVVESASMSETGVKGILQQVPYSNSVEQRVYEESYGITHYDAAVTVAVRGPNEASSSSAVDNRRRRAEITEGIKALEESTPQFGKRTRESVLDNVIDYIKYLKLQVTALSKSRLDGEPIYHPFVHLEGFGHYLVPQQMPSEPLEEVVGHLMDSSMPLAIELLESKGLELLPISSADTIVKASAAKSI